MSKEQDIPSLALSCSICNNTQKLVIDSESGETICSNCGRVISEKTPVMERGWDVVSSEKVNKQNRTGIPASLSSHDMGLATIIGKDDRDVSGNKMDVAMHSTMSRLRRWDFRTKVCTSTDRNLLYAFDVLAILKDKLVLSDAVIERSAYIYRKVQEIGFVRGRSIITVVAAAAYIACREMGITRTLDDISTSCYIRRKILSKTFRQLIIEFDFIVPMVDPVKCIVRVANNANLSEKTKRQAVSIMNDITTKDEILLSAGKDPMALAATVLYLSSLKTGENITQNNISNAAGVTAVTLRTRFRDLKKHLQLLDMWDIHKLGWMQCHFIYDYIIAKLVEYYKRMDQVELVWVHTDAFKSINYSPLNDHYRPILKICELILRDSSLDLDVIGDKSASSFTIDMNKLFEDFIANLLIEKLGEENIRLQQIEYPEVKGNKLKVRLDIQIFQNGIPLVILDTKYKEYDNAHDMWYIAQLSFYSLSTGIKNCTLVYPGKFIRTRIL